MNEKALAALAEKLGCGVCENESLSAHTTFRTGGPCTCMIMPKSAEDLSQLVKFAAENGVRTLVMGKGSNMLCADEGFDGAVLLIGSDFSEITMLDDCTIRAQAGAAMSRLCRVALDNGLRGLEFAYGIPGTVGGGIYMNAGAYGGEMKDVLVSVTAMDRNGELHTYTPAQLELTYRRSRFSHTDEIIVSGDFKLAHGDKAEIEAKMNELMARRKDKQPLEYPNAGSTFKRPEGQFAGKLIQERPDERIARSGGIRDRHRQRFGLGARVRRVDCRAARAACHKQQPAALRKQKLCRFPLGVAAGADFNFIIRQLLEVCIRQKLTNRCLTAFRAAPQRQTHVRVKREERACVLCQPDGLAMCLLDRCIHQID